MNKKQKTSSPARIELSGIGSMVFADELSAARTLYELRKLSEDASLIKSNTVNKKSGKFKKQPNSLTGRVRIYIGGLPGNTTVTNSLISTKFSGENIPTGLLSKLKEEGVLKPTDERGVYKSIPKIDDTETVATAV